MRTRAFLTFLALFPLLPAFDAGAQFVGKIVRKDDGDSLIVVNSTKIHLAGSDCPERASLVDGVPARPWPATCLPER